MSLIYPTVQLKLKKRKNDTLVFDVVRKKWIPLTPEEFVRQHFVNYLIHQKGFPAQLISIEKEINLFNVKKRYDVAVLNKDLNILLLAECKAPTIDISNSEVVEQILRYNIDMNAQTLIITNGVAQYVFEKLNTQWNQIPDIKNFMEY